MMFYIDPTKCVEYCSPSPDDVPLKYSMNVLRAIIREEIEKYLREEKAKKLIKLSEMTNEEND